jgi:hypothetical protein
MKTFTTTVLAAVVATGMVGSLTANGPVRSVRARPIPIAHQPLPILSKPVLNPNKAVPVNPVIVPTKPILNPNKTVPVPVNPVMIPTKPILNPNKTVLIPAKPPIVINPPVVVTPPVVVKPPLAVKPPMVFKPPFGIPRGSGSVTNAGTGDSSTSDAATGSDTGPDGSPVEQAAQYTLEHEYTPNSGFDANVVTIGVYNTRMAAEQAAEPFKATGYATRIR